MRHMQLRELFLKQIVQLGLTQMKISTLVNPADMLTKPVQKKIIDKFWELMKNQWERASGEKEVHLVEMMIENEHEQVAPSGRMFVVWTILTLLGVLWLYDKSHMIYNMILSQQDRGHVRISSRPTRRSSEQRVEKRSVACMSMSSWLYGKQGR